MSLPKVWYPNVLNCTAKSKAKFIKNFENYEDASVRKLCCEIFNEIEKVATSGDIDSFKSLNWFADYITKVKDEDTLSDYCTLPHCNPVILICKHNNGKLLEYLFSEDCELLKSMFKFHKVLVTPTDKDENQHSAIYYAVRSNNVELLDILIHKWPNGYLDKNKEELDELLSTVYKELKLKNIILKDEMQVFVENLLINIRFFFESSNSKPVISVQLIKSRIRVLAESIENVKASSSSKVDDRFIFLLKFIARNIYILKRQLKCTYSKLPWEEIEFFLVAFISLQTTDEGINLVYSSVLNKLKIITYLNYFSDCLYKEFRHFERLETKKLTEYPQLQRENIIKNIVKNYPLFHELYTDYKFVRDIHSLDIVKKYIELALSADPKNKEGHLIIVRTLQVVGEYFKNTVESPKLSNSTCEMLLSLLPKSTRQIIIDLRNSLSHSYSLEKRLEIEENADSDFFQNIQNDVKKISIVITDILIRNKITVIKSLLQRIVNSNNLDDIKDNFAALHDAKFESLAVEIKSADLSNEILEIEILVKELSDKINDKTYYETQLLKQINDIITFEKNKLENIENSYISGIFFCLTYLKQIQSSNINEHKVQEIKWRTNKILKDISSQVASQSLEKIAHTTAKLYKCMSLRTGIKELPDLEVLTFKVLSLAEGQLGNVKWIAELRDKLNCARSPHSPTACFEKKITIKEKQMEHLVSKVSLLKTSLSKNSSQLIYKIPTYKVDKNLQVVIEMLLLDIMSILGDTKKNLTDNLLFLDDNSPLLIGRNLRNHLAHGNTLLDILQNESSVAIVINAMKIISENIIQENRKIGKLTNNDPIKVKSNCEQDLAIIGIQNSLFNALINCSFEDMEKSIKEGADVHARNLNLWTSLHFAAQGGNAKILTFLLYQNLDARAVDKNGQTPIHIAAAHGKKDIVQLLLKKNVDVDIKDSNLRTPLHLAALKGHTNVIKFLLKNKASTDSMDLIGSIPIHYAIIHKHKEATEILLAKQNINAVISFGGYTSLHVAADYGLLELVNFLLKSKANVNAKTNQLVTPLHAASHGHLEVANALILAGAQINAKNIDGSTPLHWALETNHKMVVEFLLNHGADVHAVDAVNYTPLNFAAKNGNLEIVKLLIKKESDINHTTSNSTTSLYLAAENGHLSTVQLLLKNNASIHIRGLNRFSVLHIAAHNGHTDIVKLLIKYGANVNDREVYQRTPLHLAAMNNKLEVVEALLSLGANIDCKDTYKSTALHTSSQNGHQAVVKQLIANGANVTVQNKKGIIPMFSAIESGSIGTVKLFVQKSAGHKFVDDSGNTALHISALYGNPVIVRLFLQPNTEVNIQNQQKLTPLHFAVQGIHSEVVKMLIEGGAKVDAEDCSGHTPLYCAVESNCKEIVVDLIKYGADTNIGNPLFFSIMHNFSDIALVLINNDRCDLDNKVTNAKITPLHMAALRGQENVVSALLMKGADVHSTNDLGMTPLHCAASEGYNDIVKVLLKYKSKLNVKTIDGCTPLYFASFTGHDKVVTTLLNGGANPNITNLENRTCLEMAVSHNKIQVVKILLKQDGINVNETVENDDFTLLHIAAQMGLLDITKLLVENGANINARNFSGCKPIHCAAIDGHLSILEFYLKNEMKLDDLGGFGETLVHYAAMGGQSEIMKYLINKNMDVNVSDPCGMKPIHIAASNGYHDIIHILIDNGAYFNAINILNFSALTLAKFYNHSQATKLLELTTQLFEAVRHNNSFETEKYLKEGAVVNVKSNAEVTPLHFACWKGYDNIVSILLKNNANPNIIGKSGCMPLHYACKFNHFNIVKSLLLHKAGYNISCSNQKTPLDFATHPDITKLLDFIDKLFKSVRNGDVDILTKLNKLKDKDILRIVMSARDKDNKTIVLVGINSDFSEIKQLQHVLQDDMSAEVQHAHLIYSQEKFEEAFTLYESLFEKRKDLLGHDHPDTLKMQLMTGKMLYSQHKFKEAMQVSEVVYEKQKEVLGEENVDAMVTRSFIALMFQGQGKNEEALAMYEDILHKQIKLLGPNHSDVLDTHNDIASVLFALSKFEEALKSNNDILRIRRKHDGLNHPKTLFTQNNIAMILDNQGEHEEALEMYKKVYAARKKVLGANHSDTLRTSHQIARLTLNLKQNNVNADVFQEVYESQKNALGIDHLDTLDTLHDYADSLFMKEGRILEARKIYQDIVERKKTILGPNHPDVVDIENKMKYVQQGLSLFGEDLFGLPQQNNYHSPNNFSTMQQLTKKSNINVRDENSFTPLHYAVSDKNEQQVRQLLEQGANVMLISNKGNTVLHIAASKGFNNIVDTLLEHVKQTAFSNLNDFINAKTTGGQTAALHVADNLETALSLLKYGAIYNIENKKGECPIKVSKQKDIVHLLQIIEECFTCIETGKRKVLKVLRKLKSGELTAVLTAHNLNGETILQKASKYPDIDKDLRKYLKSLKK